MMVIRMVFEIKKTAIKINKATPIKPQFRMKVPRANKRWVSTPPSLTSETPSIFLASAETCFTYLGAVVST